MSQAKEDTFDCVVKQSCGAYHTSTVRGARASSTSGSCTAVERLAAKVFGVPASRVAWVSGPHHTQVWRAWR